jgi:hypothetical protein
VGHKPPYWGDRNIGTGASLEANLVIGASSPKRGRRQRRVARTEILLFMPRAA